MADRILTINTGSSSVKAALFELADSEPLIGAADIDRVGTPDAELHVTAAGAGSATTRERVAVPDYAAAVSLILDRLVPHDLIPAAIAHRVVHGGQKHANPEFITDALVTDLKALVPIAPEHMPPALDAIAMCGRTHPHVPQIACFDTAFHRHLPQVAQMYPLPRRYWDAGVKRYGFHGLSCEFIMAELRAADADAANGRVVIAHLGSGASLTAVLAGASVDTTMGFSPTGGVMMGTRSGDLDPGVLLYTLGAEDRDALARTVTRESGLAGVSGRTQDVRDLLARETSDPHAAEALALFCYLARKSLGALMAVLGGLDTLVFTAGIGEHAAPIRQRICAGLEGLGIEVDPARNLAGAPVISSTTSRTVVRVIATHEDRMLARHARVLLSERRAPV